MGNIRRNSPVQSYDPLVGRVPVTAVTSVRGRVVVSGSTVKVPLLDGRSGTVLRGRGRCCQCQGGKGEGSEEFAEHGVVWCDVGLVGGGSGGLGLGSSDGGSGSGSSGN